MARHNPRRVTSSRNIMAPQLLLLTPAAATPELAPAALMSVLSAAPVAALLVRRGERSAADYADLAKNHINIGQGAGCAVLLEDDWALAKRLGADGVHITGDEEEVRAALKALKPEMIVGAGPDATRHDAMTRGELDVDYIWFGALTGEPDAAARDLAQWWAETFEIPAVLYDPAAATETDLRGAEFLALGDSIWSAPSPASAIGDIARAVGATP